MQPGNKSVAPQDEPSLPAEAIIGDGAEQTDWKALYYEAQRAREKAEDEVRRLREQLANLKGATIAQARLAAIVES